MDITDCNDELLGLQEIAVLLEVSGDTPKVWRYRGRLPEPAASLKVGPVWTRQQILDWAAETNRLPDSLID